VEGEDTNSEEDTMGKLVVVNNLTLDGVMQAPGGRMRTPAAVSRGVAGPLVTRTR